MDLFTRVTGLTGKNKVREKKVIEVENSRILITLGNGLMVSGRVTECYLIIRGRKRKDILRKANLCLELLQLLIIREN